MQPNEKNPKILWGKIITLLRQKNEIALLLACDDVTNVEFCEGKLIAKTLHQQIFQQLMLDENISIINKILLELGEQISFDAVKLENKVNKADEDIEKIKNIVGDKITII